MKILSMTVLCVDFFPEQNQVYPGGNALNYAVQAKKSGADASVLGAIGDDGFGSQVMDAVRRHRLERSHVYTVPGKTASNKIYINSKGDRYFKDNNWDGGVYREFRLSGSDWDFANGFDAVATVAFDPNFTEYKKRIMKPLRIVDFLDSRDTDFMERLLPDISVGFVSGTLEIAKKLKPSVRKNGKPFIITLGSEGSLALDGDKEWHCPAVPVDKVVDTTGCGDAYQAAFTFAYLEGADIPEAMQKGAEAASIVLSYTGGID